MPYFPKDNILFIEIPSTNGKSIMNTFENRGNKTMYYSTSFEINKHSPQHCSYRELNGFRMIPEDCKIFTVIRNPYDRFIETYNYDKTYNAFRFTDKTLNKWAFWFFNLENTYDNHNKSNQYFIHQGEQRIKILKYENMDEEFEKEFGFKLEKEQLEIKEFITLDDIDEEIDDLIKRHWREDFEKFYN